MNSILTDSPPLTTFELADPSGVHEWQFQDASIRLLTRLYPDCSVFPFYPDVKYDDAVWKPDVAIVDRARGFWFVIEVEISTHHLEKHVMPQVTAFVEGEFSPNAAVQLATNLGITVDEATTILNVIPRQVGVVSNKHDLDWIRKLSTIGVQFVSIATYRNTTTNQAVHHVQGEFIPSTRSLGFGRVRAADGVVLTQAGGFWANGEFEIAGPDGSAKWICSVSEGRAWIMKSQGLIEFHDGAIVQFLKRNDGSLIVRMPYG